MFELIPDELKQYKNWVCWKAEPDAKSHSGISKKPINPRTGGYAQSNNPETWGTFEEATMRAPEFAGIGFMFGNSPFFGVDVDDIPEQLQEYKESFNDSNIVYHFVEGLQSYTEESQSGNGIHIICRGELPEGKRRKGKIEMYDSGRFFVMTGKSISEYHDVSDCTESIKALHREYLGADEQPQTIYKYNPSRKFASYTDEEIVEKIKDSRQGYKFDSLYAGEFSNFPSQSEADMALANILAFWCQRDIAMMDRIFRSSGLMREKWDRKIGGTTYGAKVLEKAASECREVYEPDTGDDYYIIIKPKADDDYIVDIVDKFYKFDDTGNADMAEDAFGKAFRFSFTDKRWLYYSNGHWSYDGTGEIYKSIDKTVNAMIKLDHRYDLNTNKEGKQGEELEIIAKTAENWEKHKKKTRSHSSKVAIEKELQHRLSIEHDKLDRNKNLINLKNVTLDLDTMIKRAHKIDDYITKMIEIDYDPDAPEPKKWIEFINEIFNHDVELIRYIQKACGYCLSGSTAEQCIFFLFGNGRNGKSTFLEIVRLIFGDYATNIQPSTIMVKRTGSGGANSDIARLKGARLVTSVEPNEGDRLDEGLIKQITGGDVVTARKLYGDEFEFCPEFKLWMATNHKPVIRGRDMGIWRRIHLVPFTVTIPDEKVDKNLKQKLAAEKSGILKWMLDGYTMWKREGLQLPPCMVTATNEYKHEMDSIASFIDSCCVVEDGASVNATELFAAYRKWAIDNNEYDMSSTKFGRELNKKYNKTKDFKGRMVYQGIRIGDQPNDYCVTFGNN